MFDIYLDYLTIFATYERILMLIYICYTGTDMQYDRIISKICNIVSKALWKHPSIHINQAPPKLIRLFASSLYILLIIRKQKWYVYVRSLRYNILPLIEKTTKLRKILENLPRAKQIREVHLLKRVNEPYSKFFPYAKNLIRIGPIYMVCNINVHLRYA